MPSERGIQPSDGDMLSESGILHSRGGMSSPEDSSVFFSEGGIMPSERRPVVRRGRQGTFSGRHSAFGERHHAFRGRHSTF